MIFFLFYETLSVYEFGRDVYVVFLIELCVKKEESVGWNERET